MFEKSQTNTMNILIKTTFLILLVSCASNFSKKNNAKEEETVTYKNNSSILKSEEVLGDSSFIVNKYPIGDEIKISQEKIKTPRPKELFSASSENEIRLHKLGEVRWVYLGLEPSSVWPMTIEFLKNSESYKLGSYDPASGTINSKKFKK